jgi:hypothetical protein
MSGAWEIREMNKVMGAFLHTDTTTVHWALGLRNLEPRSMTFFPFCGMPYDMSRNSAVQAFLQSPAQYLFFLDSDVVPPRDTVPRLMAHNLPITAGVYFRRSPPYGVPVMMKGGGWVTSLPDRGLIEVDLVGAGCLLLHRSLLESLPPQRPGSHWFDWRVNQLGIMPREECLSEDFTFCTWAKKHGIPTMVDCSVRCKHLGLAEAGPGYLIPANATPYT